MGAIRPCGEMAEAGTDMVAAEARDGSWPPGSPTDLISRWGLPGSGPRGMRARLDMLPRDAAVVEGETGTMLVDMASRRKCPVPDAARRGLEPDPRPELERLARGGAGAARDRALAP